MSPELLHLFEQSFSLLSLLLVQNRGGRLGLEIFFFRVGFDGRGPQEPDSLLVICLFSVFRDSVPPPVHQLLLPSFLRHLTQGSRSPRGIKTFGQDGNEKVNFRRRPRKLEPEAARHHEDHGVDQNEVREELCVPVNKPLVAIVVYKHVLVDVQAIFTSGHLQDDGLNRLDQRVLRRLVLRIVTDVVAVDCFRRGAGEMAGQAGNLVLGQLWETDK